MHARVILGYVILGYVNTITLTMHAQMISHAINEYSLFYMLMAVCSTGMEWRIEYTYVYWSDI